MRIISTAKLTEKKSKFVATLFEIDDEDNVQEIINDYCKEHKKANHNCYAYIQNNEEKFKNDGEVGHPANNLLNILKNNGLNKHLLIVARYFGGIKLGPGGVGRAFKAVGNECVEKKLK